MISVRLSGRPSVRPAVRPAVRPSGRVQKLNVGLISETMVPSRTKLCMVVTTMELYTLIPLLVTFDL